VSANFGVSNDIMSAVPS